MKIGIIGCGRIASDHLAIYRNLEGAQVVAVSDVDVARAAAFAGRFHIDKVFKSHSDLLSMKNLDFVDICTPPSAHAEIACDSAESGHNVLLEKPMALSTVECDRIIHAVEKHRISLCVCHNQIFFPAIAEARRQIDAGYYSVVSFRTSVRENPDLYSVPAWNTSSTEKGILWEVGCHPAYVQLHILGDVTEVYAAGNKVRYPVFDEFSVLLKTPSRSYGIMEVSWLTGQSEKIYEINCTDGKRAFMVAPPPRASEGYETLVEKAGIAHSSLTSEVKRTFKRFTGKKSLGYFVGHYYLIAAFIESLKAASPSPVTPQDGRKTVRLLECIEKSLDTHTVVSVK